MSAWKRYLDKHGHMPGEPSTPVGNNIRRQTTKQVFIILALGISILSGVVFYYSFNMKFDSLKVFYTLGLLAGVIGVTIAMLTYLGNNTSSSYISNTYTNPSRKTDLSIIEEKIDFLAVNFKNLSSSPAKIDEDKIYKIVEEGLKVNIQESFIKSLEEKYSEIIIQEIHYKDISDEIIRSKNRILNEIGSLNKRGNLNLVIGSLTTMVSVGVLFSSFLYSLTAVKIDDVLIHFLPRISIVLFAEIFAFFFLRLYRNSLIDIKYYQNELTNIESKGLALKAAILMKDKDLYNSIVLDFSKIERNGIIKNDEFTSTITLNKNESEKDKSYSDSIKSLIEVIEKLVASKK